MKAVKGMRDFLPEQMKKKQFIEDLLRQVFEKYGFQPLQTPIVEEYGLLSKKGSGGEGIKEEIYCFKDKAGRELGLRYDLTVPLARVIASNPSLPRPFKRYQISRVYRYDNPQAQRYREFSQADVDIIGAKSMLADAECISVTVEAMQKLNLNFVVKVSNRKLLEEIVLSQGVKKELVKECFRSIDKMDKIGEDGVKKELKEKGIKIDILGLLKKSDLKKAEALVKDKTGLNELKELMNYVKTAGIKEFVKVDLSLARGLDYYTGTVFEAIVEGKWSCAGGGRYDNLIEVYGGPSTPAVGISFGVDRLFDSLQEKILVGANTKLFVIPLKGCEEKALELVQGLRALGVASEMDLSQRGLSKNMSYADKKGIPFAIVLGENELKTGKAKLKNMASGKETEIKLKETEKIKELIETQ